MAPLTLVLSGVVMRYRKGQRQSTRAVVNTAASPAGRALKTLIIIIENIDRAAPVETLRVQSMGRPRGKTRPHSK